MTLIDAIDEARSELEPGFVVIICRFSRGGSHCPGKDNGCENCINIEFADRTPTSVYADIILGGN